MSDDEKQTLIQIDQENNIRYVYLQPERKDEEEAVHMSEKWELPAVDYSIVVDFDSDGCIFGVELIGFKHKENLPVNPI